VIMSGEDEGGRMMVTTDEETSAAREVNGDQLMQIGRLGSSENLLCKRDRSLNISHNFSLRN